MGKIEITEFAADFYKQLLDWYDLHRRTLPWREEPTSYHVWLSEIMLQQTRVETVRDYYLRFLAKFPTIKSFADGSETEYLKLWQGLGYYSRVRNMHKAAIIIEKDFGGEMPRSAADLQKLPGIGCYTAAAIASIAYGERVPALDGNLLRIFSRLTAYRGNIRTAEARHEAGRYFQLIMTNDDAGACRPGDFNQALMDLGNLVCMSGTKPRCAECPLEKNCQIHALNPGEELLLPVIPEKKRKKIERKTVFLIRGCDEKIAIHKRSSTGMLAGLYEFPNTEEWLDRDEALEWLKAHGVSALRIMKLPDSIHVFTHREWHMRGYKVLADSISMEKNSFLMVDSRELCEIYPLPSAFSLFLK